MRKFREYFANLNEREKNEDCGNARSENSWSTNTEEETGREHSANREKLRDQPKFLKRVLTGCVGFLVGAATAAVLGVSTSALAAAGATAGYLLNT